MKLFSVIFISLLFFFPLISSQYWTQFTSSSKPPSRYLQTGTFVNVSNSFFIFGGFNPVNYLNDIWQFSISTNTWINLAPSNPLPSARYGHTAIYVTTSNSIFIFGGYTGSTYLNDLWEYSISNNTWTQVNSSNPLPLARRQHSAIYVPNSNSMLIYGGYTGSSSLSDLWQYSISGNTWIQLTPSSSPPARYGNAAIYIPTSNSMLIFSGSSGSNDLWEYSILNRAWSSITLPNQNSLAPPRVDFSGIYIPFSNSMLIFGGHDTSYYLNDLWDYFISDIAWSQINPYGTSPNARDGYAMDYDPRTYSVILFGGSDGTNYYNDLWSYTIQTVTTQEQTTSQIVTTQEQTTSQTLTTQQQIQEITTQEQTTQQLIIITTNSGIITNSQGSGTIIGAVLGTLFGILLIIGIIIIICILLRRKNKKNHDNNKIEENNLSNPSNLSIQLELKQEKENGQIRKSRILEFDLILEELIGKGGFGEVFKGKLEESIVACKKLKTEQNENIEKEVSILKSLNHPNIVRFIGIKEFQGDKYMVMEYMNGGNLLDYIRKYASILKEEELFEMTLQISLGMEYLEEKKIIHKDLALRNILCHIELPKIICKVSDFGLSKIIAQNSYYYYKGNQANPGQVPVKWSAPELLFKEKISSKCDVFSFGVVLFEIFSKGQAPWGSISNYEVIEALQSEKRMPLPKDFGPKFIVNLMNECWKENPHERPAFKVTHLFSISLSVNFIF